MSEKNPIFVTDLKDEKPVTYTVLGQVKTLEPGPIPPGGMIFGYQYNGLVVDIVDVNTSDRQRTKSGPFGEFFFKVPNGTYYMQCYPPISLTLWPYNTTTPVRTINHFDPTDGKTYEFEVKDADIRDFRLLLKKRTSEPLYGNPPVIPDPPKTTGKISGKVWSGAGVGVTIPVVVQVINLDSNKITQTTTKANGLYVLDELDPGFYHLKVILPANAIHAASSISIQPISVIYPLTGLSGLINVQKGSDFTDKDIGLVFVKPDVVLKEPKPPEVVLIPLETPLELTGTTVSGTVWAGDVNTPAPTTPVSLVNNDTAAKYTIDTNSYGDFYFYNVPAGDYYLEIPFDVGTPVTKDATSLLNVATRKTDVFTVNGTDSLADQNIGITPSLTFSELAVLSVEAPPPP